MDNSMIQITNSFNKLNQSEMTITNIFVINSRHYNVKIQF